MAIAYVNIGSLGAHGGSTSETVFLPPSLVTGNLLIASVNTQNNTTHVWPADWNVIDSVYNGLFTSSVAWRIVDGTEADANVTWSGSSFSMALCWQYSGVLASNPIGDNTVNTSTGTPHTSSEISTIGSNSSAIYLDVVGNTTTLTKPSGWTQNFTNSSSGAYNISTGIKTLTGGAGTNSGNISTAGGNSNYTMRQIELIQELPPEPIDAEASSTSSGSTSTSGAIGLAAPASSSGVVSSESSYTFAKGAFATSSGVVSGSVSVVREKLASVISSGELKDDVLVAFLANAAAESIATDASQVSVTRFTSSEASTVITISSIANANRIYYEIAGSDASIGGLAESIRAMDVSVIATALVVSGAAGNASYNLVAESLAHMISGILYVNDYMDGWAYNLNNQAPSFYENFKFNSFAKIGNQYYGLASDGLHILGANDDNGSEINAVITTGISDFGEYRIKKVPTVYAGARTEKPLELTCRVDNEPDYTYEFTSSSEGIAPTRVKLGKGLEGRYWQFEFKNRDGADFEISDLDIPMALNSRGV